MTKITVDKALIEQALQQLNLLDGGAGVCESAHHVKEHQHTSREPCPIDKLHQDAIAALRAALAEPAVEPVATVAEVHMSRYTIEWTSGPLPVGNKLYASPPPPAEPAVEPTCKPPLQVHKPTGWVAHKSQYAVPVLFNPYTGEPRDVRDVQSDPQGILIVPPGKVEMLAAPVREPAQTTCNCRWEGDTQVQECTLHQAHKDAIHEWAERAKTAEAKLAATVREPAPVQEPVCRGCGIPINDIHMSTCPTKKWPMYVTPADAAQPAPVQEQQPVAEVKVKMTGGNVGIATVIHEIYDPAREPLTPGQKLYTAQPRRAAVKLSYQGALRALKKLAQAIVWRDFGECRGFDTDEPLNVTSALYLARTVIDRIEGAESGK